MKKLFSLTIAIVMLLSVAIFPASAVSYEQPFDSGTLGSETYRIPALFTLNDGSVIAAADIRYGHGSDSPNNIDTAVAKSSDGYGNWEYTVLNHFDDYADGVTAKDSASFIDSAIVQSSTGRIFIITDAQPAGCGYLQCKRGSGFIKIDDKSYMLLTTGDSTDAMSSFEYYIGDFVNGFAPVLKVADGSATQYSVDEEFDIYQNGAPLTMEQTGSEGVTVHQNVFYDGAVLECYSTTYIWMRYSDDNGKTWSAPVNLTAQVKSDNEYFLGICPGRGIVTTLPDGTERIIFAVYDNGNIGWNAVENVSTIYSDDNGVTWKRGAETIPTIGMGKASESQIIDMGNGILRMFSRNKSGYVAYADSVDYGVTWSDFSTDENLVATSDCMCAFISTGKTINGKKVVLGSFPTNSESRADGVIKVGLISGNKIDWISSYSVTKNSFFAYSSLSELSDGNFAILYEDEAAHLNYLIFSVDESGNVNEINNNNPVTGDEEEADLTIWDKIVNFFKGIFYKIGKMLGFV